MSRIAEQTARIYRDTLLRNSIYLMLATAVLSIFGFFFWLLVARVFSTAEIGVATALISIMSLISYLSLIGFNVAFVRFLPTSPNANAKINTGMLLVALAAMVFSLGFVALVQWISPELAFIRSPIVGSAFAIFCVISALNILTEAIFLAGRKTGYTLVTNTLFSMVKVALPIFFVGFGAVGIFLAAAFAQVAGFIINLYLLTSRFNFRPAFAIDTTILTSVWRYCASNYASSILGLLPATVLPLVIINKLGAHASAYYYIAMMVANLLYVIPTATTRALFAEVSYDESTLAANTKKAALSIGALMLPSIAFLFFAGSFVLGIFGSQFTEGKELLWFLALSGLPISATSVLNALFQIRKDLGAIITMSAVSASTILVMSYLLAPSGLTGVGLAWFIGTLTSTFVGVVLYRRWPHSAWALLDEYVHYRYTEAALTLRSRVNHGYDRPAILFYPQKPSSMHILYPICHSLGLRIINDPNEDFVAAVAFEDVTKRPRYRVLQEIARERHVINGECDDIGKEHVEEVFSQVFGYGTFVDPETYVGLCVKKSNLNAFYKNLSEVVLCPTAREPGFVYQKLIENEENGAIVDIRVLKYGNQIPFLQLKHKDPQNRFITTQKSFFADPSEYFSPEEISKIFEFCHAFKLDCGELDVLRDKKDGRMYIVDVNITSSGPRAGRHMSHADYDLYIKKLSEAFAMQYLPAPFKDPEFADELVPAPELSLESSLDA